MFNDEALIAYIEAPYEPDDDDPQSVHDAYERDQLPDDLLYDLAVEE